MRGKRLSRDAALRIGAIGLVVVAAALVLPGLLSTPDPPPLPADVGLGATGASGADGAPAETPERRRSQPKRRRAKPELGSGEARGEAAEGGGDRGSPDRVDRDRDEREREPEPAPPPPPPVPATTPVPAPAPAPAGVAPAPVSPAPAPADAPGDFGP
ncbi:MAG TPA: hypothetical protein VFY99_07695 [Solirubrobacterales bacterium]